VRGSQVERPKAPLGTQELELLTYLSENSPVTVRDATAGFGEPRGLARTTILTTMERLRAKGYLTRTDAPGVNRYSAVVAKADILRDAVRNFVNTSLRGSLSPFVAYLNEDARLSRAELDDLKALVKRMEGVERANE
jgi:predicted transcriptional regulator